MWPTDDDLLDLWRRLVADPLLRGEVAVAVIGPLEADLARQFPHADPHDRTTAAHEAVLAFLTRPAAYDPARLPLAGYLRMIARRRLANLRAVEARHHAARIPWAAVELDLPGRNDSEGAESLADLPHLAGVIESLSDGDRRALELMLDGERSTAVFAAALGLGDRTAGEQANKVKQAKDRVKARLKRAGGGG